ncbi:MAG TPA: DUF1549 domain-containing protein, partial [Gemmataceae bacterium]|nr:DUF1549 domain-containing protein [Gemmataceae bacterium]
MPRSLALFSLGWLTCFLAAPFTAVRAADPPARPVEFNRDVRPILSDACFQCHGPDKANRKAGLRLDTETGAFADLGGYRAIAPGKPADSEVLRRVLASDDSKRMPPAATGRKLTAAEVDRLRRWIEQGAKWQKHWSLLPPRRPELPPVKDTHWPRNPIDHFILARLEREGLRPSPEADRVTLIRRVTLDLTGLPPTPAEVDAFLADTSPNAYEKVVDRLLASPRYGERMAIKWLDGARYADTNGYQGDGERVMWRWRDWVIDAFNQNMPFDQFTIEQLAGDLLPGATLEQKIATGFNRNHRGNAEGGIVPEEYAVEYVVDRVDTTGTVFLGLALGCARCHDHKYDPISQKEFYRAFAYFNNVPERGKVVRFGNSPPMVRSPTRLQQERLARLEAELKAAEERFISLERSIKRVQARWEKTVGAAEIKDRYSFLARLVAHYPLDGPEAALKPAGGDAVFVPGRVGKAVALDGKHFLDAGDVGNFSFTDKFSLSAWIYPKDGEAGTVLSRMADNDRAEGYALAVRGGRLHVHLSKRWLDDAIHAHTRERLTPGRWQHVVMTYDGTRLASGVKLYVNGVRQQLEVSLDDLNQDFKTKQPLRIGWGGERGRLFRGWIDDVRVYDDWLAPDDAVLLATVEPIPDLVRIPPAARTAAQAWKLRSYFLANHAPEPIRRARVEVLTLRKRLERFLETIPTTMVMEEMKPPRDTHILLRGEYDKKGAKVSPGVPASLPPLPSGAPNDRLGFARWLVEPSNPLTARVMVNRYWQMYFGTGLVKTTEDFGSQGEWPSHPDLLDWLATEFVRTGWDVKGMQRTIVTSASYRQS